MVEERNYLNNIKEEMFQPFRNQILYGLEASNYKDRFKFRVFDYEASLGKTFEMKHALIDLYQNNTFTNKDTSKTKSLVVIKTIEQCGIVEQEINYEAKETIAVSVNGKKGLGKQQFDWNKKNEIEKLRKYPIVIITQEKYLDLCNHISIANEIFGDRDILIIDEEVDFVLSSFENISVSAIVEIEEEYLQLCKTEQEMFKTIVQGIRDVLAEKHNNIKWKCISLDKKRLKNFIICFKTSLEIAMNEYTFEQLKNKIKNGLINKENDTKEIVVEKIFNKVKNILKYYNNDNVIAYNNKLFTYNPHIKPFLLKNNIWLDASAKFNFLYELNDIFVKKCDSNRVIDHKNSTLYLDTDTKSTTSAKEKYNNFPMDILKFIRSHYSQEDKILIISIDDECDYINNIVKSNQEWKGWDIKTSNFFKMRGSNEFKEYNVCFVIHQPQLPFPYYVFAYEYWSNLNKPADRKIRLADEEMIVNNYWDKNDFKTMGFMNCEKLEMLRRTSQASSIYQGLKRIARIALPKGDFYFITTDKLITLSVLKQFYNIKVSKIKFDIELKNNNHSSTTPQKLIQLLNDYGDSSGDINLERIAVEWSTTLKNVKRILRENKEAKQILKGKSLIVDGNTLKRNIDINYFLANIWDGNDYSVQDLKNNYAMDEVKWNNYKRSKAKKEIWSSRNIEVKKVNNINYIYSKTG